MQKVLVIGASGFIGSNCYSAFKATFDTTGVDVYPGADGVIQVSDFSETAVLLTEKNFDVVVNCAGSSNVQNSFANPHRDFELNTALVERLLTTIKVASPATRFINLSSAAVYGNPGKLPISETDAPAPLSPYGEHKLQAEQLVQRFFTSEGIKGLSLRIFSAYGVGLRRQFFFDLSQKFTQHPHAVTLYGSGHESRDFVYISDIVAALRCLINNATFDGGTYNLGSGTEAIIGETAHTYADIFGYKGQLLFSNTALAGYPVNWRADITKLRALGFEPAVSLQEGMTLYANWIKRKLAT